MYRVQTSSANDRIQSKGSKTPEWSSAESVRSVQYNWWKIRTIDKIDFWKMIFLTSDSVCSICYFFSSDAKLRCPNCPWNIRNAALSRLSTLLNWRCQGVKLPKNADLMKSRIIIQYAKMCQFFAPWATKQWGPHHLLQDPWDSWKICSTTLEVTHVRQGFSFCNVASLINWVAVANSSLGCTESKSLQWYFCSPAEKIWN